MEKLDFKHLLVQVADLPQVDAIAQCRFQQTSSRLYGVVGSWLSCVIGAECHYASRQTTSPTPFCSLLICQDHDTAAHIYTELSAWQLPSEVHLFPSSYRGRVLPANIQAERIVQRNETLLNLTKATSQAHIVITYAEALAEKIALQNTQDENKKSLKQGDELDRELLIEELEAMGFTQEEFVYEPGQYARRGAILDVFSYADYYPYRIDFLDNEVDSIRRFDADSQRSIEILQEVTIVGALKEEPDATQSLTSVLPQTQTLLWLPDLKAVKKQYSDLYTEVDEELIPYFATPTEWENTLDAFTCLEFATVETPQKGEASIAFRTKPQPVFHKNFDLLAETLHKEHTCGHTTYIFVEQPSQVERLQNILKDHNLQAGEDYTLVQAPIYRGFMSEELGLNFFTDHEILERFHAYHLAKKLSKRDALTLTELQHLKPGDYVVHADYGVGIFEGLITHRKDGVNYELVRLSYRDRDSLLMSVHSLDKLSKYRSSDDTPPTLNKLNSSAWNKLKARTKRQVKDIARDLIQLYAQRRAKEGFAFSTDTYLQEELEASFQYEDTPDQLATTLAVKRDMEKNIPMDRLICADVGFGKTEIAIRAAFKAVCDSKQVAVLVPTTVLALQHFRTFSQRLAQFPARVAVLSRLQTAKEQKQIIAELAEGKIDILIGTHALLRSTVQFKDLGLLIVDEEQKFGVAAKEHLKNMRTQIDTLTLTATPIPRTLQFSLMGARDMSVIATPPPNRYPIETQVMTFEPERIAQAIRFEIQRGGQVYFINNLVQNLSVIAARLEELIPEIRIAIAHGQMPAKDLEAVMLDFMNADYDLLLCTSIVEAGLDIQNVNTIFINNGNHFGLSDLHQLRGRVGRSDRKAYCYIIIPATELLTPSAQKRLKAIVDYSDLGSGMSLAMQDLNIRGAGDLLGAEQSGFIVDLGIETYYRILDEAVEELKQEEFAELFEEEKKQSYRIPECVVDGDLPLYLPTEYVESTPERLSLYRRLTNIHTSEEIDAFTEELEDRFGPLPPEAIELLKIPQLKWTANALGIQRIQFQNHVMILQFVTPMSSPFYASATFGNVLKQISTFGNRAQIRQTESQLAFVVRDIHSVADAQNLLNELAS